jgi:hypothetical protein
MSSHRSWKRLALACLIASCGLFACVKGPEDCGKNVSKVVRIDFNGPSTIPSSGDIEFVGYSVTMTIERSKPDEIATACFIVRDEDPWYKFFWAVDDVLAAGFILFPVGQDTRTMEGHFSLYKRQGQNNICGAGFPSDSDGCSGESEAEVYLQTVNRSGPTSPKSAVRKIRLQ